MQTVVSPVNIKERQDLGIRPGDTVRVHQKIEEKGKTRIQVFEGLVLARKHGDEPGATFTVRATLSGVGVEKVYPLYSPNIDKIEIAKRSKVRRAKLYFIREKVAREMRRQLRRMQLLGLSTVSEREQEDGRVKAAAEEAAREQEIAAEEARKAAEAAAPAVEAAPEEVASESGDASDTEEKKEG